jgi:hypothetical protein
MTINKYIHGCKNKVKVVAFRHCELPFLAQKKNKKIKYKLKSKKRNSLDFRIMSIGSKFWWRIYISLGIFPLGSIYLWNKPSHGISSLHSSHWLVGKLKVGYLEIGKGWLKKRSTQSSVWYYSSGKFFACEFFFIFFKFIFYISTLKWFKIPKILIWNKKISKT